MEGTEYQELAVRVTELLRGQTGGCEAARRVAKIGRCTNSGARETAEGGSVSRPQSWGQQGRN